MPYRFGGGRRLSLFTFNTDCGWGERVVTLGLEESSHRLTPAHILDTGGTVDFVRPDAVLPDGGWFRLTVYINVHDGEMVVWQDGAQTIRTSFTRPSRDLCQFHWGAYASGDNSDVVLFEDDKSIWILDAPFTPGAAEPWMDDGVCGG